MTKIVKGFGTGLVFFMVLMFQVATGFSAVIISGIIDPILINELGVPALLVGVLLGIHYLVEPIRSYVGSLSDRFSFFKLHRAPFILLGGIILAATYPAMVLVVEQMRDPNYHFVNGAHVHTGAYAGSPLWIGLALFIFLINGTGISIMGVAGLSLVVDVTSEKVRGFVAAIGWTLLIFGIVVGSIMSSAILPKTEGASFDFKTLYPIFMFVVPGVLMTLVVIAVLGALIKEPRNADHIVRGRTHVTFRQAVKVVSRNSQVRWFLAFLFTFMCFMFMRDILAPAYAGNVYRMSVAERSALQNTINGPLLLAMIVTGLITFKISKRLVIYVGLATTILGIVLQAVASFTFVADKAAITAYETANRAFADKLISQADYNAAVGVWNSAISGNKGFFTIGLITMGLGLGIAVPGLIGTMMDMTDRANAALYIGIWGIGQSFGSGTSNLFAGGLRDLAYNTFKDNLAVGYGLVFLFQAVGMGVATFIFTRVNEKRFNELLEQQYAEAAAAEPRVTVLSDPATATPLTAPVVVDEQVVWYNREADGQLTLAPDEAKLKQ